MCYRLFLLISLIYSVFINLWLLPLKQAVKMPILCAFGFRIKKQKSSTINIAGNIHFKMITLGFKGADTVLPGHKGKLILGNNSSITISDSLVLSCGTVCRADDGSEIVCGKNFSCNNGCFIRSTCQIRFGDNVLIGWNVAMNTSDGHTLIKNCRTQPIDGPINVGNHVWIASNSIIGKNSEIGDNCVVGQMSLINKKFAEPNCLICGIPGQIVRKDITWNF